MRRFALGLMMALALAGSAAAQALELVMVEQPGCVYCARWNAEIGPIYPKTDEGKAAPLRRIALRDPVPADLILRSPPVFTPTFILIADNREVGRIDGYPGADFFWGLLAVLIRDAARS